MNPELDAQIYTSFNYYKGLGFLLSFALVVALQIIFPNRLVIRDLLKNWKVNLPMAFINLVLLALVCGACASALAVSVREGNGATIRRCVNSIGGEYPSGLI